MIFRCPVGKCKVRFGLEDNLNYHKKCHLNDTFQCIESECQYTDLKWMSFISHLWKTHKINIEMYSCDQCEFKTNRYVIIVCKKLIVFSDFLPCLTKDAFTQSGSTARGSSVLNVFIRIVLSFV